MYLIHKLPPATHSSTFAARHSSPQDALRAVRLHDHLHGTHGKGRATPSVGWATRCMGTVDSPSPASGYALLPSNGMGSLAVGEFLLLL